MTPQPLTLDFSGLSNFNPEDGGVLDLWHNQRGPQWFFAVGFEEWHYWTGKHWQPDPGGYTLAKEIDATLKAWRAASIGRRNTATAKAEIRQWAEYAAAGRRTRARVAGIEAMARARRAVPADSLDAADVLNLQNGTLDLATGQLRPHERKDLLTYCLPYEFDPAAVAPNWHESLKRIDPDVVAFLQEFAGYALTSDCRHEIAVWLYGPPGGGKSTFIAGLQAVIGPKTTILGLADIERNRFALTNLPGKTLAVATEQPGDYLASTHVLNAIVSGEPIMVDRKYAPAVMITPRAKMAWALNELPRVQGSKMKELIQAEAAGILNWALAGLQRLRARGRFDVPKVIEDASKEFAATNDIPALFVSECCDTGPGLSVGSQTLYNRYANWCLETGHKAQSTSTIARDWRRLGFDKVKMPAGMVWEGVAIKP